MRRMLFAMYFCISAAHLLVACGASFGYPDEGMNSLGGHRVLKKYEVTALDKESTTRLFGTRKIFEDGPGRYLIQSTYQVSFYDEERDQWTRCPMPERKSTILGLDRHSGIWASDGWSKSYFDGENWQILELPERFKPIFTGQDRRIWVVTKNALIAYDRQEASRRLISPEWIKKDFAKLMGASMKRLSPLEFVVAGLEAQDGSIWLAADQALLRIYKDKQEWELYPTPKQLLRVVYVYEDRKGRIWLAGRLTHLAVYDKATGVWTVHNVRKYAPPMSNVAQTYNARLSLSVYAIYQDKAGQIMFGTEVGLIVFSEGENRWELFTSKNSALPSDTVYTIMEDSSGRIWIGTGEGIVVLEQ